MKWVKYFIVLMTVILVPSSFASCAAGTPREVVVYTSVDQVYAEPVLKQFEIESGIRVLPVYDVEATKTTGLVNRLIAEKDRPLADVFWSGEFVQTLLLQEKGVLQPYRSPNAAQIPFIYKDPHGYWTGFAGRMRVLLVNTQHISPAEYPKSLEDLLNQAYPPERVGMAQPLFGTALTQAAALYALDGPEKAKAFYMLLAQRRVQIVDGNSVVREMVADGQLWLGILDSDDACTVLEKGAPVAIVIPDQQPPAEGETPVGTLVIPNTLGVVASAPHLDEARLLVDYLLKPSTEQALVDAGWSHLPLHPGLKPNACLQNMQVIGMATPIQDIYARLNLAQDDLTNIFIK